MNYTRSDVNDNADVGINTKGGPSVPSPCIMPCVPRMTMDSAPESETTQNRPDATDASHPSPPPSFPTTSFPTTDPRRTSTSALLGLTPSTASVPPAAAAGRGTAGVGEGGSQSNWNVRDDWHRRVPSFYPLEKSSREVNGTAPSVVSGRISDCCRLLSVQAEFDDKAGTASLTTAEHVEIHLSLWSGGGDGKPECTIVEAQRRTGCPIKYHEYIRHLLDAAQGTFNTSNINTTTPRSAVVDASSTSTSLTPSTRSISALEIAAQLIKKDRLDARRLGMESLCFLTDPSRTGVETSLVASRAVLFGAARNDDEDDVEFLADELGIREAILSLVQFGRLSESADCAMDSDSEEEVHKTDEDKNFNDILHNLALAVLSNALEVLEKYGGGSAPSSETKLSQVTNDFLKESEEISHRELIDSLLKVLGQAESKPHDACLSAQCLKSLLQASKKARRKARDMNAKQIVATALEVGTRTHVKLQTETLSVLRELEKPDDELQGDDN